MTGTVHSCTCTACVGACRRNPGWMTPAEASIAIAAGHAGKLMRDWLEPCDKLGNHQRIYVLAPAAAGHSGGDAPELNWLECMMGTAAKGRCVFLTARNRCAIHASGFKPIQCRASLCCQDDQDSSDFDNYAVARLWNTRRGRQLVTRCRRLTEHASC